MTRTKIELSWYLPTSSFSRVSDALEAARKVLENEHKAHDFFVHIEGPHADQNEGDTNGKGTGQGDRLERRADRADDRDGSADATGKSGSADGTDAPKRGRGRPRKEGPGSSEGSEQRRDEGADRSQEPERNVVQRTREGATEGRSEGPQRDDRSGRSGRAGSGSDEAPRVNTQDDWGDDWGSGSDTETSDLTPAEAVNLPGDEWPDKLTPFDIDATVLNSLLGDHFRATGGKDRGPTFELMERVTGARQISKVAEKDYSALAKALLKDTARYEFGLKKPK
jgi:hypothetical protein